MTRSVGSTPEPSRTTSSSEPTAFAGRFVDFWWVRIPGKLRRFSILLWAAWSDGIHLTAWPRVATALVLAAFFFGFAEGITHWSYRVIVGTNGFAGNVLAPMATADNWGGPTRLVFADNLLLLIVAVALGSLSANLGITLVLGYALGDLLRGPAATGPGWRNIDPFNAWIYRHLPLLVSYLLFFMLAALPILMAKELARSSHRRTNQSNAMLTGLTAVIHGALIYCWGCTAPMVFRTVQLWSGGMPRITVPFYMQVTATWLVPTGIIAVILRGVLFRISLRSSAVLKRTEAVADQARQVKHRVPDWARAVAAAAIITLLITGYLHTPDNAFPQLLTNFGEAELIFIAMTGLLLARAYWLPRTAFWSRWSAQVAQYPAVLRLAAATVVSYLLCLALVAVPGLQSSRPGEFGPEVATLLIGVTLTLVLLPRGWMGLPASSRMLPPMRAPSRAIQAGLVAAIVLLATRKAFADCQDFVCCFLGLGSAAAAATGGAIPGLGAVAAAPQPSDRCASERGAVDMDKTFIGLKQDQIDAYQKQLDQLAPSLANLANQIQQLEGTVKKELAEHLALEAAQKLLELLAKIYGGEVGEVVDAFTDPGGVVTVGGASVGEYADVIQSAIAFYKLATTFGNLDQNLDQLQQIGEEDNLPDVSKFVDEIRDYDRLAAKAAHLQDKIDVLKVELKDLEDKLAADEKALAECEAANAAATA